MTEAAIPKYYTRHPKIRPLLFVLHALGIKSAKVGLRVNFAGLNIMKPGAYTIISNVAP